MAEVMVAIKMKGINQELSMSRDNKAPLDPITYQVCRLGHTETPFTGKYLYHNENGVYQCVCCGHPLFDSNTKFDSGCGWPSFDAAIKGNVHYLRDLSHGMQRVEIKCANCDSHLGHVFDDGPTETKQRYCVNSVALNFDPDKGKSKEE